MEIAPLLSQLKDLANRLNDLRRYLDFDEKRERLEEVRVMLEDPAIWQDPEQAQALGKERVLLEKLVTTIANAQSNVDDALDLLQIAKEDDDEATFHDLEQEGTRLQAIIEELEFHRMFSGEMDGAQAYVDVQAGSGGTEAQDWAEMLLRMYLRFGERKGFKMTLLEASAGEVAGIKSATIKVEGEYAYGWLRTETGVHRLVRKSPFDSGNRRHTSFAAIFVSPVIDEKIDIQVNPADLRVDTYRASGAGGQHVNRTDSAIRITHIPTGIVVQCQSDRSQHKNRAQAMEQLRGKLYELEMRKRQAEQNAMEETKTDIGWGNQIRSYVLDDSRVKDLRTGVETSNTQGVLDGNLLELFITASLKDGL
ncbi:peptide chain release factor 2 [Candidatus Berkiella aquae]|uniref:peptide chain release factor 2 n=1 Tax=Candidatus Berkiella aquae TaxID=295108 RepID=UPI001F39957D|nr:peptide chain release factor 2 [Candidatus Berkiella aquae]